MKSFINKHNKLITIILSISMIMFSLLCSIMVWNSDKVFAEENSQIVNFNQIANWYLLSNDYYNYSSIGNNGYVSISLVNQSITWARIKITNQTMYSNHIYYFRQDNDKDLQVQLYNNSSTSPIALQIIDSGSSFVYNWYELGFSFVNSSGNYPIKYRCILVDMTLMFGEGNEKTAEEMDKILSSPYYQYNIGTPISTSYIDGQVDMLLKMGESVNYHSTIANSYNLLTYFNTDYYVSTDIARDIIKSNNKEYYSVSYSGMTLAYLPFIIEGNTELTLEIGKWIVNTTSLSQDPINYTIYAKSGSALTEIWSYTRRYGQADPFENENTKLTLSIPNNCDGICLFASENYWLANISATYTTTNIALLVQNALANSNKLQYQLGYDQGFYDGKMYIQQHDPSNAIDGSWSFISASFEGIGNILNLQIFPNVPLWTFIAIPLLLGLITFIYKLSGKD